MILAIFFASALLSCLPFIHSATDHNISKSICPKDFICPKFSPFTYPFYNITDSNCGLIKVNCTLYGGEIEIEGESHEIVSKYVSDPQLPPYTNIVALIHQHPSILALSTIATTHFFPHSHCCLRPPLLPLSIKSKDAENDKRGRHESHRRSTKVFPTFVDAATLFKGLYVESDNKDVGKPVGDYFGILGDVPQIYVPWCGHCQALELTYNKLAKHLHDIDSLVIAKMDGTTNEHPKAKEWLEECIEDLIGIT
ncbi:unnamed protein product [Lactuca saligna]|uniref:Thioredoxin domain-containing protein n=1 Tax=Lactuca saligna TaxID=75948 RepID=A0AA36DYD5_LACSI|nr:unnamed protein product [Lactuca saligna]